MKYSSLSGGNGNGGTSSSSGGHRWRFKSTTVKAFIICLFAFSAVFITYQLIYYMNLTEYQSQETESRQLGKLLNSGIGKVVNFGGDGDLDEDQDPEKSSPKPLKDHHPENGALERKKGKPLLTTTIVGVRPSDLHLYQEQQSSDRKLFQCFSAPHRRISWEKVNDDFCDCPLDGSDEPSTAACLNGKFYCVRKKEGTPGFIPSSRVNDGICDCLDGSDEHDGNIQCKNVLL